MRRIRLSFPDWLPLVFLGIVSAMHSAGTELAQAASIYSQVTPAQPFGAFTSEDTATGQKIADNFLFSVGHPVSIRSVRFIGGYTATTPPPITPPLNALPADNFRVVFLNDAGGSPGSPIASGEFPVGTAAQRSPTNGRMLNGVQFPIAYALDLGPGITLSPNTIYWLSIVNDNGANYGWAWARASGLLDQLDASTYGDVSTGPWNVYSDGGMYFDLNDMNVPEPGSLAILLTVISALVAIRRAHRLRAGSFN